MEFGGQLYVPAALPPGGQPCFLCKKRLGGSHNRYGHLGRIENFLLMPRNEPHFLCPSVVNLVTTPTFLWKTLSEGIYCCVLRIFLAYSFYDV